MANFFFRFGFCLNLLFKINIYQKLIGDVSMIIVCLQGQQLKTFDIGLFCLLIE